MNNSRFILFLVVSFQIIQENYFNWNWKETIMPKYRKELPQLMMSTFMTDGGLETLFPNLNVLGGCCGTDHTHLWEISEAWFNE